VRVACSSLRVIEVTWVVCSASGGGEEPGSEPATDAEDAAATVRERGSAPWLGWRPCSCFALYLEQGIDGAGIGASCR
jgi:hypothetical protein